LLEELNPELGGFGVEILILFGGYLKVIECNFSSDRQGVTDSTAVS